MAELAPVEYLVLDFPGNDYGDLSGDIAVAIADLVDRGTVRILDLVFVKKDADGAVTTFEFDQLEELAAFADIEGESGGLLSDEDVADLAGGIPTGSAALFVLWEDLWAADLARAVRAAGGEMLSGGRIPYQAVDGVLAAAQTQEAGSR